MKLISIILCFSSLRLWSVDREDYDIYRDQISLLEEKALESSDIVSEARRLLENESLHLRNQGDYQSRTTYYDVRIAYMEDALNSDSAVGQGADEPEWNMSLFDDLRIRRLTASWESITRSARLTQARKDLLEECFFTGMTSREKEALSASRWFDEEVTAVLLRARPETLLRKTRLLGRLLEESAEYGVNIEKLLMFYEQVLYTMEHADPDEALWIEEILLNEKYNKEINDREVQKMLLDRWIILLDDSNHYAVYNELSRLQEIFAVTGRYPVWHTVLESLIRDNQTLRTKAGDLGRNMTRAAELYNLKTLKRENRDEEANRFTEKPFSAEEILLQREYFDILYTADTAFCRYLARKSFFEEFKGELDILSMMDKRDFRDLTRGAGYSRRKADCLYGRLDILRHSAPREPEWKTLLSEEVKLR